MKRVFKIADYKPSYAQWFVKLDLSAWLEDETIDEVTLTAKKTSDGSDVSTTVLDTSKTVLLGAIVKPFIKAGDSGQEYRLTVQVDTVEGSSDEFYIDWKVLDDQ